MNKNRLLLSILIVYTFWYVLAYAALALLRGYGFSYVAMDYPVSIVAIGLGACAGLYVTLGLEAVELHRREHEVKAGHSWEGACVSLGRLPAAGADLQRPADAPATPTPVEGGEDSP